MTNADLQYRDLFNDLYAGDFGHIESSGNARLLPGLFGTYLSEFARRCPNSLPANKVPITSRQCVREAVPVNRLGAQVGVATCQAYEDHPIPGLFADPEAYRASQALLKRHRDDPMPASANNAPDNTSASENQQAVDRAFGMFRAIASSGAANLADTRALVRLNECDGGALKRLQANMTRYADGVDPIRREIASAPAATAVAPLVTINANALANDLIAADSKTWMMNKFLGGVNARVLERDSAGQPQAVSATYNVQGFVPVGVVKITFARGVPECLYFGDNANNCKAANQDVVHAYRSGEYSK